MAQMSRELAQSILNGNGITSGEVAQLCHFYLQHTSCPHREEGHAMSEKMTEQALAAEFNRGYESGRQSHDLTIHRKARAAHDALAASGHKAAADALWTEISRLQRIVCSACESSMESHRAREAAEAMQAEQELKWLQAVTDAEARAEAAEGDAKRLREGVHKLRAEFDSQSYKMDHFQEWDELNRIFDALTQYGGA
jgi:hypothetical protein